MINDKHPTLTKNHEARLRAQMCVPECPVCHDTILIQYDPGCTFAECKCRKWATPEEDYPGLARVIKADIDTLRRRKGKR